jgi:hypothetical protein
MILSTGCSALQLVGSDNEFTLQLVRKDFHHSLKVWRELNHLMLPSLHVSTEQRIHMRAHFWDNVWTEHGQFMLPSGSSRVMVSDRRSLFLHYYPLEWIPLHLRQFWFNNQLVSLDSECDETHTHFDHQSHLVGARYKAGRAYQKEGQASLRPTSGSETTSQIYQIPPVVRPTGSNFNDVIRDAYPAASEVQPRVNRFDTALHSLPVPQIGASTAAHLTRSTETVKRLVNFPKHAYDGTKSWGELRHLIPLYTQVAYSRGNNALIDQRMVADNYPSEVDRILDVHLKQFIAVYGEGWELEPSNSKSLKELPTGNAHHWKNFNLVEYKPWKKWFLNTSSQAYRLRRYLYIESSVQYTIDSLFGKREIHNSWPDKLFFEMLDAALLKEEKVSFAVLAKAFSVAFRSPFKLNRLDFNAVQRMNDLTIEYLAEYLDVLLDDPSKGLVKHKILDNLFDVLQKAEERGTKEDVPSCILELREQEQELQTLREVFESITKLCVNHTRKSYEFSSSRVFPSSEQTQNSNNNRSNNKGTTGAANPSSSTSHKRKNEEPQGGKPKSNQTGNCPHCGKSHAESADKCPNRGTATGTSFQNRPAVSSTGNYTADQSGEVNYGARFPKKSKKNYRGKGYYQSNSKEKKGELLHTIAMDVVPPLVSTGSKTDSVSVDDSEVEDYVLPSATITVEISPLTRVMSIQTKDCLVDTGAESGNFVSRSMALRMIEAGCIRENKKSTVYAANKTNPLICFAVIKAVVKFFNQITEKFEFLNLSFGVIDIDRDMIIGYPTIYEHSLLYKLYHNFGGLEYLGKGSFLRKTNQGWEEMPDRFLAGAAGSDSLNALLNGFAPSEKSLDHVESVDASIFWDTEPDDDGVEEADAFEALYETPSTSEDNPSARVHIEGPSDLQGDLRLLVDRYRAVFEASVRAFPALIESMTLQVHEADWYTTRNKQPARRYNAAMQEEIRLQVQKMIDLKIIERCPAAKAWSQVLLVRKPDGTWRFCLDYRFLNDCCASNNWPLPLLQNLLLRIGAKRPKYFAKLDLTAGYHQAPLHPDSRDYTAFRTEFGVFRWLRVPMGSKVAPGYFQHAMQNEVLDGLIGDFVEVYLDDILVFGSTREEFVRNLELVFQRLEKYNVTLSPKKCFLGMSEIEYVGYTVNADGHHFSREKLDKVRDFIKPVRQCELKQFLGLANYFRNHIPFAAEEERLLNDLLTNYKKKSKKMINWTPETEAAFERLRDKIVHCPSLFWMDPYGEVYLFTDACDFGIGAYLYQLDENRNEKPIQFLSKLFSKVQMRWATNEKEAYAIFFAILELKYLLRGIKFHLRTDHKNLTYISEGGSAKVIRWKLALQEYDFDSKHVAGVDNEAADAFSRLVRSDEHPELMYLYTLSDGLTRPAPTQYNELISKAHNSIAGHEGVDGTVDKLKRAHITWKNMRRDVKEFIRTCPTCQKSQHSKLLFDSKPFSLSGNYPMESISIDSIGELTADKYGYKHILVIIDNFSRFVELYPTTDLTADGAARCLLNFIGRYGTPHYIRSDGGTQFVNSILSNIAMLVGTDTIKSVAHSHEENGLVERANKEVMRHLRNILLEYSAYNTWSSCVPFVQRIMNAKRHTSLGVSPAQIIFGTTNILDQGILLPWQEIVTNADGEQNVSEYMKQMINQQTVLLQIAQKHLEETNSRRLTLNDRRHANQRNSNAQSHLNDPLDSQVPQYKVNDFVLMKYPDNGVHSGPPDKRKPNLRGPYRVTEVKDNHLVIQSLVNYKEYEYHKSMFVPFSYDPNVTDPLQVAYKDLEFFEIEKILSLRGPLNKNKRAYLREELEVEVKWTHIPEPQWEPYKNIRDTEKFIRFIQENYKDIRSKEYKLIPNKFIRNGEVVLG